MNKQKIRIFVRKYLFVNNNYRWPSFWYKDYMRILIRNKQYIIK